MGNYFSILTFHLAHLFSLPTAALLISYKYTFQKQRGKTIYIIFWINIPCIMPSEYTVEYSSAREFIGAAKLNATIQRIQPLVPLPSLFHRVNQIRLKFKLKRALSALRSTKLSGGTHMYLCLRRVRVACLANFRRRERMGSFYHISVLFSLNEHKRRLEYYPYSRNTKRLVCHYYYTR